MTAGFATRSTASPAAPAGPDGDPVDDGEARGDERAVPRGPRTPPIRPASRRQALPRDSSTHGGRLGREAGRGHGQLRLHAWAPRPSRAGTSCSASSQSASSSQTGIGTTILGSSWAISAAAVVAESDAADRHARDVDAPDVRRASPRSARGRCRRGGSCGARRAPSRTPSGGRASAPFAASR